MNFDWIISRGNELTFSIFGFTSALILIVFEILVDELATLARTSAEINICFDI